MNIFRLVTSLCCYCLQLLLWTDFLFLFVTGLWYLTERISLAPVSASKIPWQGYKRDFKLLLLLGVVVGKGHQPKPTATWVDSTTCAATQAAVRASGTPGEVTLCMWWSQQEVLCPYSPAPPYNLGLKISPLENIIFVLSISPVLPTAKAFPCYLMVLPHQEE